MITAPLFPSQYVVFDFETSGLDENTCQVVQMSALRVVGGQRAVPLNLYVKCPKPLDAKITELTGITDQMLVEQGVDEESAWKQFAEYIGGWALVGHNSINFDKKFLDVAFTKHKLKAPGVSRHIDTAMLYKAWKLNERQRFNESHFMFATRIGMIRARGVYFKLTLAMQELGIDCTGLTAHRSDADVEMTNLLYRKITQLD